MEVAEPALPIGGEFDFKIVKMNENQKRIGLSFRALADDQEETRLGDYKRQAAAATSTVGDVIKRYKSDEKTI
jgi:small subunit ribosomal protein S1